MIYSCVPQRVSRIWGSLPPEIAGEEPVGEVWWFCGSTVLENDRGDLCLAKDFFPPDSFPIIVKTLHSALDLSVQVHPGKNRTQPMKDESWVVLEGRGSILHGVKPGISPGQFKNSLEDGTVSSVLQKIDALSGAFIHLPSGTIHALGGGLTVLEVQLNCSITFRLWDYGRRDIHGNLRELHLNQGLSAINWEAMGRAFEVPGDHLDTAFYSMQKLNEGEIELGAFELAFVQARQRCYFSDADGGILLAGGETWLVRINNGK
jgi:mannose-6-phosphate isomerase class I